MAVGFGAERAPGAAVAPPGDGLEAPPPACISMVAAMAGAVTATAAMPAITAKRFRLDVMFHSRSGTAPRLQQRAAQDEVQAEAPVLTPIS